MYQVEIAVPGGNVETVEVEIEIDVEAEVVYGTEQVATMVDIQEEITSTSIVTSTGTTPNPTGS